MNMRQYTCMILIACFLLAGCGGGKAAPATWDSTFAGPPPVLLGKSDRMARAGEGLVTLSPDGRRLAYPGSAGDKKAVFVNGEQIGGAYDDLAEQGLLFSSDSRRLAFVATEGDRWLALVDGKESKRYELVGPSSLVFSPDSQRFAFAALQDGQWTMVVDGVEGKRYEEIGKAAFSPDGRRVAYAVGQGGRAMVVLDGQELHATGTAFDGILGKAPVFSPDGSRVAYTALQGDASFVVVDGVEGKRYTNIVGGLVFSPDGRRLAYGARLGEKVFVVVDGVEGPHYDYLRAGTPVFSPDSRRLAYGGKADKVWDVIVDDSIVGRYSQISDWGIVFSPDGQRTALTGSAGMHQTANVDGADGRMYVGEPQQIVFSPDSRRVAFIGTSGLGAKAVEFLVVDGDEREPYVDIEDGSLVFSPGGRWVAYTAYDGDRPRIVIDRSSQGLPPIKGPHVEKVLGSVHFDGDNEFRYVVLQPNGEYYRVGGTVR
jgi:Tol biopolymer transport system component